jgi:PTH1 family peptidyl-tRNA hydrolase
MPHQRFYLVAGLGNPGVAYDNTRHNAGFLVIEALADRYAIPLNKKKFNAVFGRGTVGGADVILAKPLAYMNRSGQPVRQLADYYKISHRDVLIIHDDIDLAFGRLKIKEKGGDGGHKGVRSIIDALSSDVFVRVRIGIGRSEKQRNVSDHVLSKFLPDELAVIRQLIMRARDAVVTILCEGAKEGMNRFNDRRIQLSS